MAKIKNTWSSHYYTSLKYFSLNLPYILKKLLGQKARPEKISNKDTLFLFGSGYSINDIKTKEWKLIRKKADTMSFNYFMRCDKVEIDYHIIREIGDPNPILTKIKEARNYLELLNSNPKYDKTRFFLCLHPTNLCANFLFHRFRDKIDNPITIYFNAFDNASYHNPVNRIYGIPHMAATLFDAVNIGYAMGYKDIVLAGVDLYDRRYFWLDYDETLELDAERESTHEESHQTSNQVVDYMTRWHDYLKKEEVQLHVYNPKSLLSASLPIFRFRKINKSN